MLGTDLLTVSKQLITIFQNFESDCKDVSTNYKLETFEQELNPDSTVRVYIFVPQRPRSCFHIYFDDVYAYSVPATNVNFIRDAKNRNVADIKNSEFRYRKNAFDDLTASQRSIVKEAVLKVFKERIALGSSELTRNDVAEIIEKCSKSGISVSPEDLEEFGVRLA